MEFIRARLALVMTVVSWASAYPAIRIAVAEYGPVALSVARLLVASVALALAAPLLGIRRPALRDIPLIAACGLTGMTLYQLLLNAGEVSVEAGTASLLIATSPLYSTVLATAVLGERLTRWRVAGIGLGFTGAAIIAFTEGSGLRLDRAALLVLGAAVMHGIYPVLTKPLLRRYTGLEVASYAMWAGTILLLPTVPIALHGLAHPRVGATLAVLYLGLVPSAVGFVMWAFAVARLDVAAATSALYVIGPLTLVISFVWLGEYPHAVVLIGGALAIVGCMLAQRRTRPAPVAATDLVCEPGGPSV